MVYLGYMVYYKKFHRYVDEDYKAPADIKESENEKESTPSVKRERGSKK